MASRRSWKGQLALGLGVNLLALGVGLGFLVLGQFYLDGDGSRFLPPQSPAESLILAPAPEILSPAVSPATSPSGGDFSAGEGSPLQLWLVTFFTVFVAEMGDKTQLATLLMSAQSQSPWAIFFGSASALVIASLLSVLLGGGLGQVIPPGWIQWLAGAGFLVMGSYVLWQEWQGGNLPES